MAKKLKQVRSAEKSRQELLTAGKKVFAQQGFAGANTRDIAREAGVNISLISYYYGGKEGLYRACLKDFGESRVTALDRLLTPPKNREDFRVRVELAVDEMVEFHLADADILAILVRDLHSGKGVGKEVEKVFAHFLYRLTEFFAEAQKMGFVKAQSEPMIIAGLIYFSFSGLIQADPIAERTTGLTIRDAEYRRNIIQQTLAVIFDGTMTV